MSKWRQTVVISGVTLCVLGFGIVGLITLLPNFKKVKTVEFTSVANNKASHISTINAIAKKPNSTKADVFNAYQVRYNSNLVATSNNTWQAASFPVENFQSYTSPFGYRSSATGGSNWEFHSGIDIAAPQGSYIRNWWAGTVIKVGDRTPCGTHVVIQSGGWEHTYCHMEGHVETASGRRFVIDRAGGIQLWEGQQIPTGVRIGRVGMTGRTTGPHLHWGLKYAKNYVDPAVVLREMFSQQQIARKSTQKLTPQQSQVIIEESKIIGDGDS